MSWFSSASEISTDSQKIERFLTRGVENVFPSREWLKARLGEGKQLSMYLGIDPTGPTLHLGHVIVLRKMKEFQELGHQVILLIGDFTGMVGDPTGKASTRKRLTRDELHKNSALYQEQASHFIKFSGTNPALLKYNSEWLSKMNFEDVLNLSAQMTVEQMLKRDMFEERQKAGQPIFIHEFLYPLLQGYDSVAMEVDGEIGGNDQTFNMLVGRDLLKSLKQKDKFVLAVKLLTDSSGKKMGKTEGNMLTLLDSPAEMFGKVMSWSDDMILAGFELLTDSPLRDIEQSLSSGSNPKTLKERLAKEIVTSYHGSDPAEAAQKNFSTAFSSGGVPENLKEVLVSSGTPLADVLKSENLIESNSELRRLIAEGAVEEVGLSAQAEGHKISDARVLIDHSTTYKIGKHRFLKVRILP